MVLTLELNELFVESTFLYEPRKVMQAVQVPDIRTLATAVSHAAARGAPRVQLHLVPDATSPALLPQERDKMAYLVTDVAKHRDTAADHTDRRKSEKFCWALVAREKEEAGANWLTPARS